MLEMTEEEFMAIPHEREQKKRIDIINQRCEDGEVVTEEEIEEAFHGTYRLTDIVKGKGTMKVYKKNPTRLDIPGITIMIEAVQIKEEANESTP